MKPGRPVQVKWKHECRPEEVCGGRGGEFGFTGNRKPLRVLAGKSLRKDDDPGQGRVVVNPAFFFFF